MNALWGALACVAAIALIVQTLRWLARRDRAMYARISEISARHADVQARAAERALLYDQTPVSPPPGDGPAATGAGTSPDPAPVVVHHRVRIEMGGPSRHREVA